MLSWEKPFSRETEQWLMFKASVVSIEKWKFEMKKKSLRKKDTTEPEAVKYVEILWTITQWIEHYLCNISMHILHTVLHTFLEMLERRTCLAIKSFFSWWSFLYPCDLHVWLRMDIDMLKSLLVVKGLNWIFCKITHFVCFQVKMLSFGRMNVKWFICHVFLDRIWLILWQT